MVRTINDIKQQCVSTYLGFSLPVDFNTPDEVGAVINRCYNDVVEKALRMYPWSFCRKDGTIIGIKENDPSKEHFAHYATISDYLFDKIIPSSATVSQIGTLLSDLTVDITTLENKIGTESDQTLTFVYDGANWLLNSEAVNIAEYGVSFEGTPVNSTTISVIYTAEAKIEDYVTMQAVFYDPKHWSKCFDWKQFGKDTIKFAPAKLYVEYTANVDPDDYPAYFADYVACALAVEVCAPLRIESKLGMLLQQLNAIFLDARKQDSMSEPAPASFDNIIDEARNML